MKEHEVYVKDPKVIEAIANAFYGSANILGKHGGEFYNLGGLKDEDEIGHDVINEGIKIPQMVLQAFAAELYLKSTLFHDNKVKNGHNLYELFSELDKEKQDVIKQKTKECIIELYPSRSYSNNHFEILLNEISEVFVEWRYVYEKESIDIDIQFFDAFINGLFRN